MRAMSVAPLACIRVDVQPVDLKETFQKALATP
jgi:hypothetical protein